MSANGSTQQSLRKALGTLKDSTKVGLAKVNSEYKVLSLSLSRSAPVLSPSYPYNFFFIPSYPLKDVDVAIVKATNHDEKIAKEKHIRSEFLVTSDLEVFFQNIIQKFPVN